MIEEYWITKEGKKIAVSDLTEEHAKNILRQLLRYKRLEEESDILDMDDWIPDTYTTDNTFW